MRDNGHAKAGVHELAPVAVFTSGRNHLPVVPTALNAILCLSPRALTFYSGAIATWRPLKSKSRKSVLAPIFLPAGPARDTAGKPAIGPTEVKGTASQPKIQAQPWEHPRWLAGSNVRAIMPSARPSTTRTDHRSRVLVAHNHTNFVSHDGSRSDAQPRDCKTNRAHVD